MRYSMGEIVRNAFALAYTRLRFPGARLVRRPIYIRERKRVEFGPDLTTGYGCRFDLGGGVAAGTTLTIGRDCRMGDQVHIVASQRVEIGDNCLMASKIFISDTAHGFYQGTSQTSPESNPHDRPLHARPVRIGDNVWIGENVCILPGASLGDGCIVNANAVVTKHFPPGTMVAGVPARPIKLWNSETGSWEPAR